MRLTFDLLILFFIGSLTATFFLGFENAEGKNQQQENHTKIISTDSEIQKSFSANIQNPPDTNLTLQYSNPPIRTCNVSTESQNGGMDIAIYLVKGRSNLSDWSKRPPASSYLESIK